MGELVPDSVELGMRVWEFRYEGTGRSLSLKLISQLRQGVGGAGGRVLKEVQLEEPIRYSAGDGVERWLYDLLCLDSAKITRSVAGCPSPCDCQLYVIYTCTLYAVRVFP